MVFNISIFIVSDEDCYQLDPMPKYAQCLKRAYGKYLIHIAAQIGDLELVKYLVKSGENPNIMDFGAKTPLLVAALNNNEDIVSYLVEYINEKDNAIQKKKENHKKFMLGQHLN